MPSALEICTNLYALGGSVPASRAGSWVPPETEGWLPVQCYALKSGEDLLLVDTGLPLHRPEIGQGLKQLVAGTSRRSILTTRREPDTIVNLPWLVSEFDFRSLYLNGLLNPLDYFESFEFRTTEAQIDATGGLDVNWIAPGQPLKIAGLNFAHLLPLVRVLQTDWFYESSTKALFTSDFGGFFCSEKPVGPFIWNGAEDDLSDERIADIIGTKCEWLRSIDTRPMIENVTQLIAHHDVHRICSSFGGVIDGRDNVLRVLDRVMRALTLLSKQSWRSSLKDFNWEKAMAAF